MPTLSHRPASAQRLIIRAFLQTVSVFFVLTPWRAAEARTAADEVFVDVAWVLEHEPVLVDARAGALWALGHLPGAVHAPWYEFTSGSDSGLLSDETAIAAWLSAHGVTTERPVVVYGQWDDGWGEEGRIFWMLEYLGHPHAHILDGGYDAWQDAGSPELPSPDSPPGEFMLAIDPALRATRDEVLSMARDDARGLLLDTRNLDEFQGATPYGEVRGGHIPTAEHLDWRTMLAALERGENPLAAWEPGPTTPIVAYCTGGVRSGFAYAVLRASGVTSAANYDGSFWEWAADPSLPVAE